MLSPGSGNTVIKSKLISRRMFLLTAAKAVVMVGLVGRLISLQINQSTKYKSLSDKNRFREWKLAPERGVIKDFFDQELASNEPLYQVHLVPENTQNINQLFVRLKGILNITDKFSENGLDFYRALLDLSERFRSSLVESLSVSDSQDISPEQVSRILDALRDGESLVRSGLSEKANFEVTLFRAIEAGRTRSIDQVIRKISKLVPQEAKKKTNLKAKPEPIKDTVLDLTKNDPVKSTRPSDHKVLVSGEPSEILGLDKKPVKPPETIENASVSKSVQVEESVQSALADTDLPNVDTQDIESAPPRQSTDPDKIKERIGSLPPAVRKVVEEKFRGEYFALERIDPDKLI